jgi:hypothetical protein
VTCGAFCLCCLPACLLRTVGLLQVSAAQRELALRNLAEQGLPLPPQYDDDHRTGHLGGGGDGCAHTR